ncbi:3-deoxy-D-manno-octulosonic acid transferase [candidate division KSB1 bacterium]|nr:3-deoxy-D-manno-octulosonic acid transferase [candidate division KSB1 bacterium]
MQIIYNLIVVPLLYLAFHAAGLFNEKIRRGIHGRENLLPKIKGDLKTINKTRVWFHISSYGEFEQAKPVMTQLKAARPDLAIIVTFFSPSAYENIKLAPPVDYICYLPMDSRKNARQFISIVKPVFAVVVRHDIWPNYIWELNRRKIPVVLIDASIPEKSSRLLPVFQNFNRALYNSFDSILTISEVQTDRIAGLLGNSQKIVQTGDTKFDQVYHRTRETGKVTHLASHPFLKGKNIWVIGSSWQQDESRVLPAFERLKKAHPDLLMIIAPHEPTGQRVEEIERRLSPANLKSVRYSEFSETSADFDVLIMNKMGLLANIYSLGMAAFVGGSYEQNVHNVLEPAAHGIPVLFGPKIDTQPEAGMLLENGGGFIVRTTAEIEIKMSEFLGKKEIADRAGENAQKLVMEHVGAAEQTTNVLLKLLGNRN